VWNKQLSKKNGCAGAELLGRGVAKEGKRDLMLAPRPMMMMPGMPFQNPMSAPVSLPTMSLGQPLSVKVTLYRCASYITGG
jgi:hypothetical protein